MLYQVRPWQSLNSPRETEDKLSSSRRTFIQSLARTAIMILVTGHCSSSSYRPIVASNVHYRTNLEQNGFLSTWKIVKVGLVTYLVHQKILSTKSKPVVHFYSSSEIENRILSTENDGQCIFDIFRNFIIIGADC